jgi:NAD(P)-dependent dehydrogenase (short-subunit alcohol dehydrogenase family)
MDHTLQPSAENDPFSLAGKTVLVVGGTRGIGRAIALRFAAVGAKVIVNYVRDEAGAQRFAAAAAESGLEIATIRADASSDKGREQIAQAVSERFANLSVLVYAAATGVHRPFEELSARHFDFTFALNVKSFLAFVQTFVPRMAQGSSILALSSEGAVHAMPHYGLIGASKAALESLCRQLAVELGPRGIRVNVLSPGTVVTDAWNVLPDAEARLTKAAARTPRGSLTTLNEVATAAQFLASDSSLGVNGHTLVVDAGARIVGSG